MIKIGPPDQEIGEFKENDLVCYCFQFTRKQIEKDYIDNGLSVILEKITSERKLVDVIALRKTQKVADV